LVSDLGVGDLVHLEGFVSIDQIPELIVRADLGIVPHRKNAFTDLQFPTKAFEYIVMGVPVTMARTGAVVELFTNIPDLFFHADSVDALATQILALHRDPRRRQRLLVSSGAAYQPFSWTSQKEQYLRLIQRLASPRIGVPSPQFR
jgi:glycosyltransferase involved in cell wall biosynthesis